MYVGSGFGILNKGCVGVEKDSPELTSLRRFVSNPRYGIPEL
jgi:hypothetical protein